MTFSFGRPTFGQAGSGLAQQNQERPIANNNATYGFSNLPTTTQLATGEMNSFSGITAGRSTSWMGTFGSNLLKTFQLRADSTDINAGAVKHKLPDKPVVAPLNCPESVVGPSSRESSNLCPRQAQTMQKDESSKASSPMIDNNGGHRNTGPRSDASGAQGVPAHTSQLPSSTGLGQNQTLYSHMTASSPGQSSALQLHGNASDSGQSKAVQLYGASHGNHSDGTIQLQNKRQRLDLSENCRSLPPFFFHTVPVLNVPWDEAKLGPPIVPKSPAGVMTKLHARLVQLGLSMHVSCEPGAVGPYRATLIIVKKRFPSATDEIEVARVTSLWFTDKLKARESAASAALWIVMTDGVKLQRLDEHPRLQTVDQIEAPKPSSQLELVKPQTPSMDWVTALQIRMSRCGFRDPEYAFPSTPVGTRCCVMVCAASTLAGDAKVIKAWATSFDGREKAKEDAAHLAAEAMKLILVGKDIKSVPDVAVYTRSGDRLGSLIEIRGKGTEETTMIRGCKEEESQSTASKTCSPISSSASTQGKAENRPAATASSGPVTTSVRLSDRVVIRLPPMGPPRPAAAATQSQSGAARPPIAAPARPSAPAISAVAPVTSSAIIPATPSAPRSHTQPSQQVADAQIELQRRRREFLQEAVSRNGKAMNKLKVVCDNFCMGKPVFTYYEDRRGANLASIRLCDERGDYVYTDLTDQIPQAPVGRLSEQNKSTAEGGLARQLLVAIARREGIKVSA